MEQNTIHGLMKIGPPEFMERLYKNGEIYMKEFLWFKNLEGDKQRSDKNEGLYMLKQAPYLKIRTEDGKEFEFIPGGKWFAKNRFRVYSPGDFESPGE